VLGVPSGLALALEYYVIAALSFVIFFVCKSAAVLTINLLLSLLKHYVLDV